VIDFLEFYLQALFVLIGGTLLSAAVGTGVVLGACFIIADYINAKMTVKELQTELHDADCTTSNIPLQRAAFVTKNRRLSRWLALLLASDCGRRLQAIIMVTFGAQSDLQRRKISRLFSPSQRAIACARAPAASRRHDARSVTSPMIVLPSPPNQRVSLTLGDG